MKYLKGISCSECNKKFFVLAKDGEEISLQGEPLCSDCLKVKDVEDHLKEGIKDILQNYDDSPSAGRYKIEDI